MEIYEYAGFKFIVTHVHDEFSLEPAPGQHPAAYKQKHRMAATQCYAEDAMKRSRRYATD